MPPRGRLDPGAYEHTGSCGRPYESVHPTPVFQESSRNLQWTGPEPYDPLALQTGAADRLCGAKDGEHVTQALEEGNAEQLADYFHLSSEALFCCYSPVIGHFATILEECGHPASISR